MRIKKSPAVRFWANVKKTNSCWNWVGYKNKNGYGQIRIDSKKRMATHRFSWELHKGLIPTSDSYHGTCVLHKCDNPSCVNPDHLYLGSQIDNIKDMETKNRRKSHSFKGEEIWTSKLTEKEVLNIRSEYKNGNVTQQQLANKFNVTRSHIGNIIRRRLWKHI